MQEPDHIRVPLFGAGGCRGHALVDVAAYHLVEGLRWHLASTGYARRIGPRPTKEVIYMHRLIADAPKGMEVDHLNRDRLDNRRDNLRLVSHKSNMQNVTPRGGASKYRGVSWSRPARKWRAHVKHDGKQHHLGLFESELAAAEAAHAGRMRLLKGAID